MSTDTVSHPAFHDEFDVFVIGEEAAVIRSDLEEHVLYGRLHAHLAPLLDGERTPDEIADTLIERHPPEHVYFAIERMRARGWLRSGTERTPGNTGGGCEVIASITLRTCGSLDRDGWVRALRSAGLDVTERAGLTLFLARDYLDDSVGEWNRAAQAAGRPWLLASPGAGLIWAGPYFIPGQTACWQCVEHQLRRNRQTDAFLRLHARRVASRARAVGAHGVDAAAALFTAHAAAAVAGRGPRDTIVRLDPATGTGTEHAVRRRPQCPVCGDAGAYTRRAASTVVLAPRDRARHDGGYRAVPVARTLERLTGLLDPLTGVVPEVRRIDDAGSPSPVYVAGGNGARPWRSLAGLRRGLRSHSSGKGMSDEQARASALAEHVERYCGIFQGDEPRVRASLNELGDAAIDPDACQLFSDRQFGRRTDSCNDTRGAVPVRFHPDAPIDWTPVTSLTREGQRYLPTALLYYDAPDPNGFFVPDSNGAAAGNTLEEAVLQGMLELVERDAAGIWWYGRFRRPCLDWRALGDARIEDFMKRLEATGREAWLLDLTTDIDIPVFAAISRVAGGAMEAPLVGLGCHLDAGIAAGRALSELGQMHAAAARVTADPDEPLHQWLTGATLADHPYIGAHWPPTDPAAYPQAASAGDLFADIETCRSRIERVGLEVLVLDQTRPDVDFAVAKVVVPGLRHIRPRFAPGRLYSVPAMQGWTTRRPREEELNPVAFFL